MSFAQGLAIGIAASSGAFSMYLLHANDKSMIKDNKYLWAQHVLNLSHGFWVGGGVAMICNTANNYYNPSQYKYFAYGALIGAIFATIVSTSYKTIEYIHTKINKQK